MQLMELLAVKRLDIEDFVFDCHKVLSLCDEVSPAHDPFWRHRGGTVKERCLRRSPVHEKGIVPIATESYSSDIQRRAIVEIQSPKTQREVSNGKRSNAPTEMASERVTFGTRLGCSPARSEAHLGKTLLLLSTSRV